MIIPINRKASRIIPIIGILCLGIAINVRSQGNIPGTSQQFEQVDNFRIKVDVEEVLLDAVVVDGKGRQITDLTADDFEIYQDKKRQEVTGCQYISYDRAEIGQQTSSNSSQKPPAIPAPSLKREVVQRTIIFLINDFYSLNNAIPQDEHFINIYRARTALRKFVDDQMISGDLVSIIRASRGNATLQAFTPDKQELLSRIESIQWSAYNYPPTYIPRVVELRKEHNFQLLAINYCLKALQDVPGRKILMLITSNTSGPSYFNPTYDKIADAALRAGVVIHTMNPQGISYEDIGIMETSSPVSAAGSRSIQSIGSAFDKLENKNKYGEYYPEVGRDLPLPEKTGGLFLDNNWFTSGIGDDTQEMIKGYYLLSYIPPEKTFSESDKDKYHSIKIKVNRKGATVHTRDGFFGNPTELDAPAATPPPLVETMFSPFQYNDLRMELATGYIDNLSDGYLLPTWMHLDGQDLQVKKEENGKFSVSFEAGASTTDIDGLFQDFGNMQIGFSINEVEIRKLREDGINFSVSIPVKEPGGYYVRAAVRDQLSDAKGSAYEFIEIPDLKKNHLALSSLYIIGSENDAEWIQSIATRGNTQSSETSKRITFKSPARKEFRSGDSFEFMTVIYNAKTKKENPPELESQVILYKDGEEFYQGETEAINLEGVTDYKRIPIRRKLLIGDSMQPGDYILQFLVKDKNAKEKESLTAQTLSFRVVAED